MFAHNKRVFGLDALRAFAILIVVFEHGYSATFGVNTEGIYGLPIIDGVAMFFVLSGFLIGRILLKMIAKDDFNGKMLIEFWVRRWFRTLPNYFLVLTLLVIFIYLSGYPQPDAAVQYFFFSQNLVSPHPSFFPEAWSLAVEEWFYLITPIPLYLTTKLRKVDRRHLMLFWITAVILSVTAFRIYRVYNFGYLTFNDWDYAIRTQVLTRLDSLMFGVLGAYTSLYNPELWGKAAKKGFIVGISLLLFDKLYYIATHSIFYLNHLTLTLTSVGTLLLLPKLSTMKRNSDWIVRTITFISLISYSVYLLNLTPVLHIILPVVMRNLMALSWHFNKHAIPIQYIIPMISIMYLIITLTASFFLYQYFELPMTALRNKFHPHDKPVVAAFTDSEARAKS